MVAPSLEMMNKWFTHFLWDVENGVEEEPKAWIVREGDMRSEPTPYADFPNPPRNPSPCICEKAEVPWGA